MLSSHIQGVDQEFRDTVLDRVGLRGRRYAAVTVLEGPRDDVFLPALEEVLRLLLNEGTVDKVAVVVQSTQDLEVTRTFHAHLNDERATLVDEDLSPEELMAIYAGARCVIARRMHSAIFSLVTGTPTFAVVFYGKKVQGVMRSLGLEHYLVDYPVLDVPALTQRIRDALADEVTVRKQNLSAVSGAAQKLEKLPRALAVLAGGVTEPQHGTEILTSD